MVAWHCSAGPLPTRLRPGRGRHRRSCSPCSTCSPRCPTGTPWWPARPNAACAPHWHQCSATMPMTATFYWTVKGARWPAPATRTSSRTTLSQAPGSGQGACWRGRAFCRCRSRPGCSSTTQRASPQPAGPRSLWAPPSRTRPAVWWVALAGDFAPPMTCFPWSRDCGPCPMVMRFSSMERVLPSPPCTPDSPRVWRVSESGSTSPLSPACWPPTATGCG